MRIINTYYVFYSLSVFVFAGLLPSISIRKASDIIPFPTILKPEGLLPGISPRSFTSSVVSNCAEKCRTSSNAPSSTQATMSQTSSKGEEPASLAQVTVSSSSSVPAKSEYNTPAYEMIYNYLKERRTDNVHNLGWITSFLGPQPTSTPKRYESEANADRPSVIPDFVSEFAEGIIDNIRGIFDIVLESEQHYSTEYHQAEKNRDYYESNDNGWWKLW